jgi:hypothetical protein
VKHCDQCGERVVRPFPGTDPEGWEHTATGSPFCVVGVSDGVVTSWSAEACVPCGTEGCLSNDEHDALTGNA